MCPKIIVPKDETTQRQLRQAIQENFMTAHLNREDQQDVFNAMFPVQNKKGDVIIRQGEEGKIFSNFSFELDCQCVVRILAAVNELFVVFNKKLRGPRYY